MPSVEPNPESEPNLNFSPRTTAISPQNKSGTLAGLHSAHFKHTSAIGMPGSTVAKTSDLFERFDSAVENTPEGLRNITCLLERCAFAAWRLRVIYWRDAILFFEYSNGDNDKGLLRAGHLTGLTEVVAQLLQRNRTVGSRQVWRSQMNLTVASGGARPRTNVKRWSRG